MIIALSHLGMDDATKDEWTSTNLAEKVNGIDLIIDGHSHTNLPEGMMVNGTLIAQAGEYDKNLGIVEVHIKDNKVINTVASQFTKEEAEGLAEDQDVLNAVADVEKENEEITSVVVAESDQELNGEREYVRSGQTNLGNLITKAMIEATDADIALTNGGGIRASISEGEITRGDIITVLPFGNYVVKLEITGEEIKEAMEHGLSQYPALEGLFPHIAGMKVQFDSSQPAGERVVDITINGEALDEDEVYSIATNDFLAAGGDGYTMLGDNATLTEYGGLDEILTNWMNDNGTEGAVVDDRLEDIAADETTLLNQAQ
jgi:2',3'-cyclic-nucleotide 2'-phosphodiesterase (5'-nucleotidase family)